MNPWAPATEAEAEVSHIHRITASQRIAARIYKYIYTYQRGMFQNRNTKDVGTYSTFASTFASELASG
jgi:hypothetical protein